MAVRELEHGSAREVEAPASQMLLCTEEGSEQRPRSPSQLEQAVLRRVFEVRGGEQEEGPGQRAAVYLARSVCYLP